MKLHLPAGLRSAILACFAAVSSIAAPPITATVAGGMVAVSFICAASPAQAESVTWDANWGISDAPTDIEEGNVIDNIPSDFTYLSSSSSTYPLSGQTVVRLADTVEGATEVVVIGGAGSTTNSPTQSEGAITTNTWLEVTGGTYQVIVGGSNAQNFTSGPVSDFTGDSHILLTSSPASEQPATTPTVDYIIGGNYKDGQDASFNGSSYISVEAGNVAGSIVGAATSAHTGTATFTNNSNIWVYTPLSSSAAALYYLPNNLIVGGGAGIANASPSVVQGGNSQVTLDFSAYVPEEGAVAPSMDKVVIGDSWINSNGTSSHTGNSQVNIKGSAQDGSNVLFSSPVVGASYFAANGMASLSGNSSVSIDGGSFSNVIAAGSYLAASGSGTDSSTIDGSLSLTLAGNTQVSGENALILGGSYVSADSAIVKSGAITLTISGGNYAADVVGGSYITAANGGVSTQETGDISLTISGGTLTGSVYGGSYTERNSASTNTHGAISVNLEGGTVLGNVYAGGGVGMTSGETPDPVESGVQSTGTTVTVSDSVVLGAEGAAIIVDGGVQNSNAASSISGERKLVLNGSSYSNLANVTFQNFSVVENASAAAIRLQEVDAVFTKQGDGELSIVDAGSDLNPIVQLTVAAGVLDTGTALLTQEGNGLTSLTVGSGASLKTAGLTLAQGANVSLDVATLPTVPMVAVAGAGNLQLLGDTKSLNLSLTGADSLAAGSSITLMSWNNAEAPFAISDISWTAPNESYQLNIVDNTLVLEHMDSNSQAWAGGSGTWGADGTNWEGENPTASTGKDVHFNTPTEETATVTIDGEQTPASVLVNNAEGTTYVFAEGTDGSIAGATTTLTKENEGTLVINLSNTYGGGTTLNGGILEAGAEGALGTGAVSLEAGELRTTAANAVAGNALELNGGTLHYSADETRNLNSAGISHAAGIVPAVVVDATTTATWQYSGADGTTALQNALGEGLTLSGGGTLVLEGPGEGAALLAGDVYLEGNGTVLELASPGQLQLGSAETPMGITLAEGTTLRVERPQAEAVSEFHAALSGEGTLEFANPDAAANNSVQLSGNNASFAGSVNLGSADTAPEATTNAVVLLDYSEGSPVGAELNLNGLGFALMQANGMATTTASAVNVNRSTVQYSQTDALVNTFSAALSGAAGNTWELDSTGVDNGQTNNLTGDISGFEGTLAATGKQGSAATWNLGGEGSVAPAEIAAGLSADNAFNEFVINYAAPTTLSGSVTGQANVTQAGAGLLTLTGNHDSSGTLTINEGSSVQLGSAADAATWGNATAGSTLAGAGTFVLTNGTLAGTLALEGTPQVEVNVAAGKQVDFGGNEGSLITEPLALASGSTLVNVGSSIVDKVLNFTLAADNVGQGTAGNTAMVQFADDSVLRAARAVTASLGSTTADINLDASATAVVNLLRQHRAAGAESYLTLTNGELVTAENFSNVQFAGNLDLLRDLGLRIDRVDGGSLVLSGAAEGVYIAGEGEDPTAVAGYQNLGAYQAVAVMPGETLLLTLNGAPDPVLDGTGAVINNLLGGEGSEFVVNNIDPTGPVAVVVLNNSAQAITPTPEGLPGDPQGADTTFEGSISDIAGDVEFIKDGAGTLTVGGTFDAHQLTAQEGTTILNADGNAFDILAFDGGTTQLANGTTETDSLEDSTAGGTLAIGPAATLVSAGNSSLEATRISGTAAGAGTLQLEGELALADTAGLDGVAVDIADGGSLVLDETSGHTVASLNGTGVLQGNGTVDTAGLSVTGVGGSYAGSLAGVGTLTVAEGGQQGFTNAFVGNAGWNLVNNGRMGLDFVQANGSNSAITLNTLSLGNNSVTSLRFNAAAPTASMLTLTSLMAGQGAAVNLSTSTRAGRILTADTSYIIGRVSGGQAAGVIATLRPDATNASFALVDAGRSTLSVDAAGNIVLNLVTNRANRFSPMVDNLNSATGANLVWSGVLAGRAVTGTDLRTMFNALVTSANPAETNRVLAAAAGAGIPVMSSAFAADMERQLRAIRNRTTIMGGPRSGMASGKGGARCSDLPRFNAWINGEGDHRKMNAGGYMSGYSLSSWGGTLGFDVDCSECTTAGLAFTAMYGDLDARSADNAKGDFDRYYLTAFARMNLKRWTHTFVGSVGRLDADLDRTVWFGTGGYRTHGSTKGWGFGALYELGYTIPMNEQGTFFVQPVANVSWRHAGVDGYTESGSDAALQTGDQDYDVVTFGAGLRTQAVVGERLYNRRSIFEARALVKVDAGDREGEATVSMLTGTGAWGKVRSEKLSAVGVELGAGITIPMGNDDGALFIDGSAELRNSYSNLNGTVGYRLSF